MNKKAFSFIEILITISILTILAIVATTANNNIKNNSYNTKVISDLGTIESALISFSEANTLASPDGNNNNFSSSGSYVHDYDNAFGTYGKFSEDTLGKMYLDSTPLDPRTNQYYSYGITRESNQFEIAGVIYDKENDTYLAKVVGDYTAENGPYNLIKEYNGNSFVTDKGSNLPYNPYERVLVATDTDGNVYIQGDTIENNSGSELEIYFSDGSVSIIEDGTTLVLSEASFPSDTNLSSNISLFLQAGTIWTKASKLDDDSSFDVFTDDATASVRGTIFAVSTDESDTTITLDQGELAIYTMTDLGDGNYEKTPITKSDYSGLTTNENGEDVLISDGSSPTSVKMDSDNISSTSDDIEINQDLFSESEFEVELEVIEESDSGNFIETVEEEVGNNSCYIAGTEVSDGEEFIGYSETISENCQSKTRLCENGVFTDGHDDYIYANCAAPEKCGETYSFIIDGNTHTGHKSGGKNIGDTFSHQETISISNGHYNKTIDFSCDSSLDYTSTQQAISLTDITCDSDEYIASIVDGIAYCEAACSSFEIDGVCQDSEINPELSDWDFIAYAPYNSLGDLKLYKDNGNYTYNKGSKIIMNCSGWSGGNCTGSNFSNRGCSSYDKNNSFCYHSSGVNGIYLNENPGNDYIKYTSLNLDNDFVIEINVRMNNDGDTSYLFYGNGNFKLYEQSGNLKFSDGTSHFTIGTIENDNFNNILIKRNSDNKVEVKINEQTWVDTGIYYNSILSRLYVGSKNTYNQVDDIIDYVKIYTKQ